jgi:hypothetical protein
MLMRILVQDGVRRMIGIQRGLLLGVGRIGLAAGSVTYHYQDEGDIKGRRKDQDIQVGPGAYQLDQSLS